MSLNRAVSSASRSSKTSVCTSSRPAAVQIWPLLRKLEATMMSAALSRSASAHTTMVFLPPSSAWNGTSIRSRLRIATAAS